MLKRIATNIRAAVVLIVAEDAAALRALLENTTNLISKSIAKHQNGFPRCGGPICQNRKKP
jgi:hypothetical protein